MDTRKQTEAAIAGRMIRALRREANLTAPQLADLLAIPEAELDSYEQGQAMLPLRLFCEIAEVMDVPLDVMAHGFIEEMNRAPA